MTSPITVVLVNSAVAFGSAFASIVLVAALARYIAGAFATDRASRIAAFGVAVGYALGRFPEAHLAKIEELPAISPALGAIAALVAVWAWLLRKGAGEFTGADGQ